MNKTTAQQALEALKLYDKAGYGNSTDPVAQGVAYDAAIKAIAALEADLAQPVEPVLWQRFVSGEWEWIKESEISLYESMGQPVRPLYAAPQEPAAPAPGFTGLSDSADFEAGTWTFLMDPGYRVGAGQYMITRIPKAGGTT